MMGTCSRSVGFDFLELPRSVENLQIPYVDEIIIAVREKTYATERFTPVANKL